MRRTYLPTKESELVTWSNNFARFAQSLQPSIGITTGQVAAFAALNTAWVNAYNRATADATNSKSAGVSKRNAKRDMISHVRQLVKIIQGCPTTTDEMRSDLQITIAKAPSPSSLPGTPDGFKVELTPTGALMLKWKNRNATGCVYNIHRKLNGTGELVLIGRAGKKRFVDLTIPAGTSKVEYQVQAMRSTGVSEFGIFELRFGGVPIMGITSDPLMTNLAA